MHISLQSVPYVTQSSAFYAGDYTLHRAPYLAQGMDNLCYKKYCILHWACILHATQGTVLCTGHVNYALHRHRTLHWPCKLCVTQGNVLTRTVLCTGHVNYALHMHRTLHWPCTLYDIPGTVLCTGHGQFMLPKILHFTLGMYITRYTGHRTLHRACKLCVTQRTVFAQGM